MAIGVRKRRRIQLIVVGGAMLALATGLIGYAMRDGIEFFRSPSQLAAEPIADGQRFRLGGLVTEGSVVRGQGTEIRFTVTDGAATLPVAFSGVLPDLFREGQGVIAAGRMDGGTFIASEVLARHDESYMPKEVADALKAQGVFRYGGGVSPGASPSN